MIGGNRLVGLGGLATAFALGAAVTWFATGRGEREAATGSGQIASEEGGEVDSGAREKTWYTCGMHPEVVQDHPGRCPKCDMKLQPMPRDRAVAMGLVKAGGGKGSSKAKGKRKILYWKSSMIPGEIHKGPGKDSMGMDLVPVYKDEVGSLNAIRVSPVTQQNMGVRLGVVKTGPLVKSVRTVAYVDYDETTLTSVTTKMDGWVEKLYVDQTGIQVHEGEPLFELYSRELYSAQEEYLVAIRHVQKEATPFIPRGRLDSEALVEAARMRLEYFDISDEQIKRLAKSGKIRKTLTIRAPFTGIVTIKRVVEGQRIKAGTEVYRIADLSTVWVMAKVFEYDLPYVKRGQEALMRLSYLPGRTFRGRVTYIYPYLEAKTREVPIRMEFHNPGYELKPGMYATVKLAAKLADSVVLVPDIAVIDTGTRKIAFVTKGKGTFEPRELKIGARGRDDMLQVLSGLAPGEEVVLSGQFLLDSESRLREAALKMLKPGKATGKAGGARPIATATAEAAELNPAIGGSEAHAVGENLYYVCPMPEHADLLYDSPGPCPICGMKMVPVLHLSGQAESAAVTSWTCPMPEHASVREPGPGKCPLCGMTLIPVREEQPEAEPASAGAEHSQQHKD